MSRNGSGSYSLPATMAQANTVASSTTINSIMDDIALGLTDSVNKDGTKAWAANQSLGGFKLTSMAAGSARTDNAQLGQVQDGKANWVVAGGTADVITATYAPAITTLVDGQECFVRALAANATTTPNFSPNTITAHTIVKNGGVALAIGDIAGAGHELHLRYLLASTRWELLNPAIPAGLSAASTTDVLIGTNTAKFATPDSIAALWEAGADITDGAAITIGEGGYFNLITSTTAITSFSITTNKTGRTFLVRFDTARTLTHNATSLIIPGGANITTAQGDIAQIRSLGGGNVVVDWYSKASGLPVVSPPIAGMTLLGTLTTTSGTTQALSGLVLTSYVKLYIVFNGVSGVSSTFTLEIGNSTADDVTFTTVSGAAGGNTVKGYSDIDLTTGVGCTVNLADAVMSQVPFESALTKASTGISVTIVSGGDYDAGSILIYGVK
ncbi:MAG TPA: hypothetical protein VM144_09890 [Aestuariivirga sp.]|nr:hypothetical protein [Aestuariivirga sp.]